MEEETNVEVEEMQEETLEDNPEEHEFDGTTEEEGGEESEVEDSENLSGDDGEGDSEEDPQRDSQNRAKAQIDRLKDDKKKLQAKVAKYEKGDTKESEGLGTNTELIERTYLAANGIKDKEIQNEVLRLAHKFDISVDEAMDDTDISARAETLMKKKKARLSVAKGTGGASTKVKGVSHVVAHFKKTGDFPAGISNDMIAQATQKLAER